jgi:tetratricopeptide (TPR) repeat protein
MLSYRFFLLFLFLSLALVQGCRSNSAGRAEVASLDPCAIALAPHNGNDRSGSTRIDQEIAHYQQAARRAAEPKAHFEQLGWKFVEKARLSYDPGYYKIADQCAACIESRHPQSAEAMLLRGHVLHNLHRFKEAEEIARLLVSRRGLPYDYGLLGDVLMEQGKLSESIVAYQRMMDMKPGPQAYNRASHVRWLQGDLEGARVLLELAAQAAGQGDPESAAWAYTRLSLIELQSGSRKRAIQSCDAAMTLQPDYAPGLLACGRVLMAEGRASAAIPILERAAKLSPLPEYQWTLAEVLRVSGREAAEVESQLVSRGESDDPRTLSLYLATRGQEVEKALRLAQAELKARNDVYTIDAGAWALAAAGRHDEAYDTMQRALVEGTKDARIYFHAAVIAAKAGRPDEARTRFKQAHALRHMLLPSEREQLRRLKL